MSEYSCASCFSPLSFGGQLGAGSFPQHAHEESLAASDAGDEAVDGFVETVQQGTRDVPFGFDVNGYHLHVVVLLQEIADVLLVLLGVKGAGAVYQQTARVQTRPGVVDNLALQLPALLYVLFAPLTDGCFVLAEHTLARAGHIAENEVEHQLCSTVVLGVVVGDDMVFVAPLRHILQQDVGTIADGLVAVEHAVLGQVQRVARSTCHQEQHRGPKK